MTSETFTGQKKEQFHRYKIFNRLNRCLMNPLVFMCVNVGLNINYICYEETMLCKSSDLFIIIKFYLAQLSYKLASKWKVCFCGMVYSCV
jgi:hypothetical protein